MIAATARGFEDWRSRARELLYAQVPPADVLWNEGLQRSLFDDSSAAASPSGSSSSSSSVPPPSRVAGDASPRVPEAFLAMAETAAAHADPERFDVLYRLLWKVTHGTSAVLSDPLDPDVARARAMIRAVKEDEHRMHAFVRFRPVRGSGGEEHFIAWYRPDHHVLDRVAPFFARRYPSMTWSLFTPDGSVHWDGRTLTRGPAAPGSEAPPPDALDALFVAYYESIYNPARTNVPLLNRHVPRRIQAQLPEAAAMQHLPRAATTNVQAMTRPRRSAAETLLPEARDLESLAAAARACRACPIGDRATQTVFGEGPANARLVIVGEQPGNEEDLSGTPFVGPAGRVLDALMERAGIERSLLYVTNAVKHFKWEPRGKRRMHSRPIGAEIDACQAWLFAELAAIRPAMILCLGSTAGQAFSGRGFRVQRDRGKPTTTPWSPWWMATYHPSAILRASTADERSAIEADLLADLVTTRDQLRVAMATGG